MKRTPQDEKFLKQISKTLEYNENLGLKQPYSKETEDVLIPKSPVSFSKKEFILDTLKAKESVENTIEINLDKIKKIPEEIKKCELEISVLEDKFKILNEMTLDDASSVRDEDAKETLATGGSKITIHTINFLKKELGRLKKELDHAKNIINQ